VRPKDGSAFSPFGSAPIKDGPVGVVPKDGSGTFSPFGQPPPEGPVGVRPRENAGGAEGEMPQRGGQGIWDHLGWLEKGGGGKGPPAPASGVRPKTPPSGVRPKQQGEL
jgi:hypothetical protein